MIHIDRQVEPLDFDNRVRRPGRRFLQSNPRPTSKQWRNHSYWREIGSELHDVYGGICAYSCHWIPYDTGADTVEHFQPKDTYPDHAYEWDNYRLVCATLNGRKGTYEDVVDPFVIQDGWFVIDFPSMLVKAGPNTSPEDALRIKATIDRLGLNDEGTCLKSRVKWLSDYCGPNGVPFEYLQRHAPFIASELIRQGLRQSIQQIFSA